MPARRSVTALTFAMVAVFSVSAFNFAAAAAPSHGKAPGVAPVAPPVSEEPPIAIDPPPDCLVPEPMPLTKGNDGGGTSPGDPGDPDCGPIVTCDLPLDVPPVPEPIDGNGSGSGSGSGSGDGSMVTGIEPVPSPPFLCPNPWPNDGATHVSPVPGVIDPHAVAIDHISVSADGLTLTVYWWGGVRECNGLAGVTVDTNVDGSLKLTVLEGIMPGAEHMACIDIAMLLATDITLDTPVFTDGSQG